MKEKRKYVARPGIEPRTPDQSGVLGSIPGLATYFRFSFRMVSQGSWVRYLVWQHTFISPFVSQGSWVRYPVWQHTSVSPSAFSRRAVVSYWRKYVHEVLVNRLGGLSLPRKSVVRLTDRPDLTLDVYRGCKTTIRYNKTNGYFQEPAIAAMHGPHSLV